MFKRETNIQIFKPVILTKNQLLPPVTFGQSVSFPIRAEQTIIVLGTTCTLDILECLEQKVLRNKITNQNLSSK